MHGSRISFFRLQDFGTLDVIPSERKVRILVRVTDSLDLGVTGLEKNDFEVLENNEDKVSDLESGIKIDPETIPYQIKTVLLLDISKSVEGKIPEIKSAVTDLINAKVSSQEFAIYVFDSEVKKILDFTDNTLALLEAIDNLPEEGLDNSTNLYQAIINAAQSWEDKIDIDRIEEGSMIIFTDGKHNADPGLTAEHALQAIRDRSVFVAALNSPNLDQTTLEYLARDDQHYLLADDVSSLTNVFLDIQSRILTQSKSIYYITYTSPISVSGNQNLKIFVKDNRNPGADCMIEKYFSSHGF